MEKIINSRDEAAHLVVSLCLSHLFHPNRINELIDHGFDSVNLKDAKDATFSKYQHFEVKEDIFKDIVVCPEHFMSFIFDVLGSVCRDLRSEVIGADEKSLDWEVLKDKTIESLRKTSESLDTFEVSDEIN